MGSGEEDLRCRSLLIVCQRRLGLSEAEDTRLEKYSFFEDRMSLWYWFRRDLKEDQSAPNVFSMAEGGPKCTEGGVKPWV